MKRKTIKQLEAALVEANETAHRNSDSAFKARNERDAAVAREKETREQFEDLKRRLFEAESEQARLRGYLARVHEDDIVRDGMIEIEDENGKRQVPKRPPPMQANSRETFEQFDSGFTNYGERKKKTHWTSY